MRNAGPGVVSGAADDDPAGIGTYTITGAQFGPLFLWTAWISWPLMAVVQMACARIGMATGQGLAGTLKQKFPSGVLALSCFALFIANTLNVGADLAAMADCASLLGAGPSWFYVPAFGILIAVLTVFLNYDQIARVLKWLSLSLFSYVVAAFLVQGPGPEIWRFSLLPSWPHGRAQWAGLLAILGTTISPYLFFWQTSQEVEEKEAAQERPQARKSPLPSEDPIFARRVDVGVGTFFSNLVMYFVILTSWLTLHKQGLTRIETSAQAAQALAPVAGRFASWLYSIGLLGVGFLAIPTLTGSAAYALAETFGWREGLSRRFGQAKAFYGVIAASTVFAILINVARVNPLQALYGSSVVNGALAPFYLVGILMVLRDPRLMREKTAPWWSQILIAVTAVLMFMALGALFLT